MRNFSEMSFYITSVPIMLEQTGVKGVGRDAKVDFRWNHSGIRSGGSERHEDSTLEVSEGVPIDTLESGPLELVFPRVKVG
jgi:hypothetical protein